jgi:EpsI family protein
LGQTSSVKIIILALIFVLTGILAHWQPTSIVAEKKKSLSQALINIPGWENNGIIELDPKIVEALKLDDYVNHNFTDGETNVSLYIGYYLTSKKVGAAHDPLVCFPGQGWKVSELRTGDYALDSLDSGTLSYSTMTAQLGMQKALILYWFQSFDRTNPDTFSQKATLLWKKILGQGEENAFVRITISLSDKSIADNQKAIFKFVRAFYPIFLDFVKEGNAV